MKAFIISVVAFWLFAFVVPAALFMMALHRGAAAIVASAN